MFPTSRAFVLRPLALAAFAALVTPTFSQTADDAGTVVVTGSMRQQKVLDAPFAIGVVDAQALRDAGPLINLSEAMGRVPGLVVANRNNYAQDLQISSRGYGARAGFGVRGLRLYTDGIPATMPDGQGQVGHFDLAGAQRLEVLRGPFSVLYGASSGGVIAMFTAPATERSIEVAADAGSFGLRQGRVTLATPLGQGFDLRASLGRMETDGFRPQSAADRQLANIRLGWQGSADTVTAWLSDHTQDAQDPLGVDPASFNANPRGTAQAALDFNTRKTIRQTQLGVNWRHRFEAAGPLRETSLTSYYGSRGVTQFLAIPVATQGNPRHGGGVVDFDRLYGGTEARATFAWDTVSVVAGVAAERQDDDRRGYENFTGTAPNQLLGVVGRQRRDERNQADTRDVFAQASWDATPALNATLGVRSGRMAVSVTDRYPVSATNIDDSGALRFSYTNPVAGLRYTLAPGWTLHASVARGYESPTLGELAYGPNNSGFNLGLKGQTSRQLELGSKWRSAALDLDAALFKIDTDDEIGVFSNAGGRSSFQNVGRTERYGAEFAGAWRLSRSLRAGWALSVLHAQYQDSFTTCAVAGCPTPNAAVPVAAGNRIAGTQKALAWAELAWQPGVVPGEFGLEVRGQAATAANDTNTVFAPGFGVVNLRWRHNWALGTAGELQTLVRVDNAADRAYVGSVIVNDANGRFYEAGAPRSLLLSLRWIKRW